MGYLILRVLVVKYCIQKFSILALTDNDNEMLCGLNTRLNDLQRSLPNLVIMWSLVLEPSENSHTLILSVTS